MKRLFTTVTLAALLLAVFASSASADYYSRTVEYEVTITNITKGQVFSPPVLATHKSSIAFFTAGQPAIEPLIEVAENGAGGNLADLLSTLPQVYEAAATAQPIPPKESVTFYISSNHRFNRLSVASMLVNTNDAFLAIDTVSLPRFRGTSRTYFATAYDAGSEANNEDCTFIPGPACKPANVNERSITEAEGFVHVHNGVHGIADLEANAYDWRNPVARVHITRIR